MAISAAEAVIELSTIVPVGQASWQDRVSLAPTHCLGRVPFIGVVARPTPSAIAITRTIADTISVLLAVSVLVVSVAFCSALFRQATAGCIHRFPLVRVVKWPRFEARAVVCAERLI